MQLSEQINKWIDELQASAEPSKRRMLLRRITETVQGQAGLLRHEVIVTLLWALRDDDPSIKRLAIAWLPRLDRDNPQVEDVAIAHIYDKDLRVREGATFFLWLVSSKRCQGIMRQIIEKNDSRFPNKHWGFQLLSGQDIATDTLLQYLTDAAVLDHVLVRLAEIQDPSIAPALVAAIEQNYYPRTDTRSVITRPEPTR